MILIRERSPVYAAMKFDGTPERLAAVQKFLLSHGHMSIAYTQEPEHLMLGLPMMLQHYWVHPGYWVLANTEVAMGMMDDDFFTEKYEMILPE